VLIRAALKLCRSAKRAPQSACAWAKTVSSQVDGTFQVLRSVCISTSFTLSSGRSRRLTTWKRHPGTRAKDTGLRNLPLHGYTANQIWTEIAAIA
jgi:hypothetical protein